MSVEIEDKNDQQRDALIEKLVSIRRVTKVVKGGRVMTFSALTVVGDGNGRVGFGTGKAREVPVAIKKAMDRAKQTMRDIPLSNGTIVHPTIAEFGATKITLIPASEGTGVIAGGAMRAVMEAAGVHNLMSKITGSRNDGNVVRAAVKGLTEMHTVDSIAAKRGKTVAEILGN
jgi:small subunit ribosomal protein S5